MSTKSDEEQQILLDAVLERAHQQQKRGARPWYKQALDNPLGVTQDAVSVDRRAADGWSALNISLFLLAVLATMAGVEPPRRRRSPAQGAEGAGPAVCLGQRTAKTAAYTNRATCRTA